MAEIVLITPTGGRPRGMELLAGYIDAQTYQGEARWVIVDDVDPATPLPDSRFGIEVIRPPWRWKPGNGNTHCQNMSMALDQVSDDDTVIIFEDDDVYLPEHLAITLYELETCELVGEVASRYYNVASRCWRVMGGKHHTSLASVGVRGGALQLLREICYTRTRYIDIQLWQLFTGPKRLTDHANYLSIKGLPGRAGIGVGHSPSFGLLDTTDILKQWIGDYAENYKD